MTNKDKELEIYNCLERIRATPLNVINATQKYLSTAENRDARQELANWLIREIENEIGFSRPIGGD